MPRKRPPKHVTTAEAPQPVPVPTEQPEPVATPPATEAVPDSTPAAANDNRPSFVEKLARQRQPGIVPDPFGIAGDTAAGVRLFESRRERLMIIKFEQKPSADVLDHMKDNGFRWNPRDQVWVQPIYPERARQIRVEAERTYQEVCQMIRQERGLGRDQDIPF